MDAGLLAVAGLGLAERCKAVLDVLPDDAPELERTDPQGRNALHLAALSHSDECVELLLTKPGSTGLAGQADDAGNTPLHYAATGSALASYDLASAAPGACLTRNTKGLTPIELANKHGTGEVLNAMLLACAGCASATAVEAMTELVAQGAVCDTWAPNGQSSLMLAAATDSEEGVRLLLQSGATVELQDSLGRTALMWAAGSGAYRALKALLDAGASMAQRDRRGRAAADYAEEFPQAAALLQERLAEMERKAQAAQEALLQELSLEEERKVATKASKKAKKKEAKSKKKSEGGSGTPTPPPEAAEDTGENELHHGAGGVAEAESTAGPSGAEVQPAAVATPAVPATPTPPGECPTSPEWHTVGKGHGKHAAKPPPAASQPASSVHDSAGYATKHQRCMSSSSMASTSSGESHETDNSKYSGSERSVLRHPNGALQGPGHLPAQHAKRSPLLHPAPPASKPAAAAPSTKPAQDIHAGKASWAAVAAAQYSSMKEGVPVEVSSDKAPATIPAPAAAVPPPVGAPADERPAAGVKAGPSQAELAAVKEVAVLRAQLERARLNATTTELAHQAEVAAVMQDAARHEAAAVAQAVADERMQCIVRFAGMLQSNGAELLAAAVAPPQLPTGRLSPGGVSRQVAGHVPLVQQQQPHTAAATSAKGRGVSGLTSSLSTFLNNSPLDVPQPTAGQGSQLPPSDDVDVAALAALGFAPVQARASTAIHHFNQPNAPQPPSCSSGSLFSSPLSTSPFAFGEMGEFLRGEYSGNHSAFVVPASEGEPAMDLPLSTPPGLFTAHMF